MGGWSLILCWLQKLLLLQLINSQVFGFRYIVGLAGPPGAGKSTVSKEVTKRVNALWLQTNLSVEGESGTTQTDVAIALPMDGFHLYRSQLDMMEVKKRNCFPESFNFLSLNEVPKL